MTATLSLPGVEVEQLALLPEIPRVLPEPERPGDNDGGLRPLYYCLRTALSYDDLNCANQYAGPLGLRRLHNLMRYVDAVRAAGGPSALLVGEAAGYRGCAVTGIPFTSRAVLQRALGRWSLFGPGFDASDDLGAPSGETSATVVWRTLVEWFDRPPLLWNVFPFHPHVAGDPQTNRAPATSEIDSGQLFLFFLWEAFGSLPAIAVGKTAERVLTARPWAYTSVTAVRPPAHGGAR